jgi:hypothetical protein
MLTGRKTHAFTPFARVTLRLERRDGAFVRSGNRPGILGGSNLQIEDRADRVHRHVGRHALDPNALRTDFRGV